MFFNYFKYLSIILILIIFIPSMFIPTFASYPNININYSEESNQKFDMSNSKFSWPIPGYTRISSYFGKRTSPTNGASSYHLGIDIPAPAGTNLVAPLDSKVISIGFNGSGGYTIILSNGILNFIFHHVSPNYIISKR